VGLHWSVLWQYRAALWDGLLLTLELSAVSAVLSLAIGTLIGSAGAMSGFFGQRLAKAYVELLRNVPVIVKVFFLYFVVGLNAFPSGLVALSIHQSAYIADIVAAGFRTVPAEQFEAGRVLGHRPLQILRYVVLPQVFTAIIPPLTSQFIEVVKNSSVVMMVGIEELTFRTQQIETETFRGFEAAVAVTVLYLIIAVAIAVAMSLLDQALRSRGIVRWR